MRKLVYFGPSGIGDWMFILPSLQALLQATGCERVVAVLPRRNPANRMLLASPLIERVEYLDRPDPGVSLISYLFRLPRLALRIRKLRGRVVAISYLSNQPDTLLLAWLSGASRRIGHRWRGGAVERMAITDPIATSGARGKLALHARYADVEATDCVPVSLLPGQQEHAAGLREQFGLARRYVVLGIGGGREASWRFWPAENYRALAASLPDRQFVMLGGGADDRAAADRIMRHAPDNVLDLVDKIPFHDASRILANADACIGNDSGIANLAAAHGIPTVCLYGPTDPSLTGPALLGAYPVSIQVPCGPCFGEDQNPSMAKACSHHSCLVRLDVVRVATALNRIEEERR